MLAKAYHASNFGQLLSLLRNASLLMPGPWMIPGKHSDPENDSVTADIWG